MKKRGRFLFVLVVCLVIFIAGCSGNGGDQGVNSTKLLDSKSADVTAAGGIIQMSDGTSITIGDGVIKTTATVTIKKYDSPLIGIDQSKAVSPTYQIQIPINSLDNEAIVNGKISIKIPSQSTVSGLSISSIKNKATLVWVSTINKATYAAKYVESNANAVHEILGSAIKDNIINPLNSEYLTITNTIIDVNESFAKESRLYKVTDSTTFTQVTTPPNLNGKIPIILVHGIQLGEYFLNINNAFLNDAYQFTWTNFTNYFYKNNDAQHNQLTTNFELYSYSYDTSRSVFTDKDGKLCSAKELGNTIQKYFGTQKVIVIAHSMGGLVTHTLIQKQYSGSQNISKLITLATPFHGSPLSQYYNKKTILEPNRLAAVNSIYHLLNIDGANDLAWDNYDSSPNVLSGNTALTEINSINRKLEIYRSLGSYIVDTKNHDGYKDQFTILKDLLYEQNDGVVPLKSAQFYNHLSASQIANDGISDYDHTQMHDGKTTFNNEELFFKIKDELMATIRPTPPSISGRWQGTSTFLTTTCPNLPLSTHSSPGTFTQNGTSLTVISDDGAETLTGSINGYDIQLAETVKYYNPNDPNSGTTMQITVNATLGPDYKNITGTFNASGTCTTTGTITFSAL